MLSDQAQPSPEREQGDDSTCFGQEIHRSPILSKAAVSGAFTQKIIDHDLLRAAYQQGGLTVVPLRVHLDAWKQDLSEDLKGGTPVSQFFREREGVSYLRALPPSDPDSTMVYCCFGSNHVTLDSSLEAGVKVLAAGKTEAGLQSLESHYALLYDPNAKKVSLHLNASEFSELPLYPGSEYTRGGDGWYRAVVDLNLDDSERVQSVYFPALAEPIRHTGWLSRNSIGVILENTSIPAEFPSIFESLKRFLVLDVHFDGATVERFNEKPVSTQVLTRARSGAVLTHDERKALQRFLFVKSSVLRRLALEPVQKLFESGQISGRRYQRFLHRLLQKDIDEDARFMERSLLEYSDLTRCTLENLAGLQEVPEGLSLQAVFLDKGMNKQVYRVTAEMSPNPFHFVMSTVRAGSLTLAEFDRDRMNASVDLWREASESGVKEIPTLGYAEWFLDYHPRVFERPVHPGGSNVRMVTGEANQYRNHILVIAREFVEGVDGLSLLRSDMPDELKREALREIVSGHFRLWEKTESQGQGMYIRDPKPANSILHFEEGEPQSTVIDLDKLVRGSREDLRRAMESFGFEPQFIRDAEKRV